MGKVITSDDYNNDDGDNIIYILIIFWHAFHFAGKQPRLHRVGNLSNELAGKDDRTSRSVFTYAQREQRRRCHSGKIFFYSE